MEKVIDIEERIPSLREKRRRMANRKFIFILTVFIIALLVILYFRSPLSQVSQITVSGATLHDPSFYKEKSGLTLDEPLWGFTLNDVETTLAAIEGVESVSVTRKWLRDVEINISEWATIAYIEKDGQYSLLLESGEVFSTDSLMPEEDAPILNGFSDAKARKQITAELMKMDKGVFPLISEIVFSGTEKGAENVTIYMDDGFEVRAIMSTFAEKMAYYPDITAQLQGYEKGVIDMEVGTFFSPFSEVYGSGEEGGEEVGEEVE